MANHTRHVVKAGFELGLGLTAGFDRQCVHIHALHLDTQQGWFVWRSWW